MIGSDGGLTEFVTSTARARARSASAARGGAAHGESHHQPRELFVLSREVNAMIPKTARIATSGAVTMRRVEGNIKRTTIVQKMKLLMGVASVCVPR